MADRPYCRERERSRLWSGRMCWSRATYGCTRCGKPVCHHHKRDGGADGADGSLAAVLCLSCALGLSGGLPPVG